MERESIQEKNRALADWVTGGISSTDALKALCALAESRGASAGVVFKRDEVVDVVTSGEARDALLRVARSAGAHRVLWTLHDAGWSAVFPAGETTYDWLACEPVASAGTTFGLLVTMGLGEASRDVSLLALPEIARACAPILQAERAVAAVPQLKHQFNNLAATILGNVEFVAELLETSALTEAGAVMSLADKVAASRAIEHAHSAVEQAITRMNDVAKVAGRRGPG